MKVITDQKKPIKLWLEDIEDGALDQARNLANLPFLFKHVAIMPDAHLGYGMPIGGVIACDKVVIPNAVGVDIGCGLRAVRTSLGEISTEQIKQIMGLIRERIPVGFDHQEEDQRWNGFDGAPDIPIIQQQLDSARKQLGTLGGGNHFIEIQKGDDGFIWIMVHSGSRNFGYKVAKEYNKIAQRLCTMWCSSVLPFKGEDGLAFLPIEAEEAYDYMRAMHYVLEFAHRNREMMLDRVQECFLEVLSCEFEPAIDIHHNYAAWENHFGRNVIVHRKGATLARKGTIGIIPGSQGTSSYIVEGLGNPESFMSCSHGAGRTMGRRQAKRELDLESEIANMDELGIVHGIRHKDDLDEAPSAYKDIDTVMENQADLVKIKVKLKPLGVVKG